MSYLKKQILLAGKVWEVQILLRLTLAIKNVVFQCIQYFLSSEAQSRSPQLRAM